ncbi:pyridoxamine 5'-phosphate oxidase family protein [Streptomyces alkaliphilus]|uniref:Pyridoxamine 5'-phosphate oxidase family protein n=1 Tax=Streptomyces alkaliphilus TaxID=1472722 RepID=A0A7W3Y0U4_9ACTN|nr:pyridoxamine 5'-phosphate oxidase family protein [Streptomyces alkaliphilus]MBB0243671.1 pyridoxamine 5'-phosphate oxidase family protein [Streptomyces alkaliphilus]
MAETKKSGTPGTTPTTELHPGFSEPGAAATPWPTALETVRAAEIFWLSTVRADGRPHVTPLLSVWVDDAPHFTTGPGERKALNLATNPHCVLTTGTNALGHGLDITIEGPAERVTDDEALRRIAHAYLAKYGSDWAFTARDGMLHHEEGGEALAFRIAPTTAFGFAKGTYSQTRWRF